MTSWLTEYRSVSDGPIRSISFGFPSFSNNVCFAPQRSTPGHRWSLPGRLRISPLWSLLTHEAYRRFTYISRSCRQRNSKPNSNWRHSKRHRIFSTLRLLLKNTYDRGCWDHFGTQRCIVILSVLTFALSVYTRRRNRPTTTNFYDTYHLSRHRTSPAGAPTPPTSPSTSPKHPPTDLHGSTDTRPCISAVVRHPSQYHTFNCWWMLERSWRLCCSSG